MTAKKKTAGDIPGKLRQRNVTVALPEILDQVPYSYSNHARISCNKWEVRIAFGEIGPTGKLDPKTGVILPHITARGLLRALTGVLANLEERLAREIVDSDHGRVEVEISQSGGERTALPGSKKH